MIGKSVLPLVLSLIASTACQQTPAPESVANIDTSFELVDEAGKAVTSDQYSGRLRLVFFGFTSCPDICPITLQNISMALNSMGALAEQVTVLFISVDPKRDTPQRLRQYTEAFHPSIIGLTGTYEQILAVTTGMRTTFGYNLSGDDGQERALNQVDYEALPLTASYSPYHSSQVYVIGANDNLLDIIGYGSTPSQIEKNLRKYLD
jgi:cytochrome oxidase Cu insertion factor (SCO1/SenC/PrrC family)